MDKYVQSGKLISHVEDKVTLIARAEDGEKAHFLTAAANAYDGFDYMAEADRTCSVIFNPQNVNRESFFFTLRQIVEFANMLNVSKKLLFRGKSPEEVGRNMPALHESLAVEFDPNNPVVGEIDLLHGIVGVITEAGEMAEVLIHRLETGKFDTVNAFEENGDVTWYLARQLRGLGTDFATMQKANIDKLHGRHGEAFDVFRDANRDLHAEREKLATAAPLFDPPARLGEYEKRGEETQDPRDSNPMQDEIDAKLADYNRSIDARKLENAIMPELKRPEPRTADTADMVDRLTEAASQPRARNNPPLPASVGKVEHVERKPAGDCEGMDC